VKQPGVKKILIVAKFGGGAFGEVVGSGFPADRWPAFNLSQLGRAAKKTGLNARQVFTFLASFGFNKKPP
jgi:hypothetical protein